MSNSTNPKSDSTSEPNIQIHLKPNNESKEEKLDSPLNIDDDESHEIHGNQSELEIYDTDEEDNNNEEKNQNYLIPKIVGKNDEYEDQTVLNLFKDDDSRWNAGHLSGWDVSNFIIFDFEKKIRVTEISLRNCGDLIHDVKRFELQTSDKIRGPWRTIFEHNVKGGITSWQNFILSGVSRYWKLNIPERYSRHQTYLLGLRFNVSYELGRFEHLSNVEKEFLRKSKRKDVYPNESIGILFFSITLSIFQS